MYPRLLVCAVSYLCHCRSSLAVHVSELSCCTSCRALNVLCGESSLTQTELIAASIYDK